MSYLLGTNVVSELRKRAPHPAVTAWFDTAPASDLFLSCLTIGEIRLGVDRLRRAALVAGGQKASLPEGAPRE